VLLNLEPDHLDWHEGFDNYREAKLRIFRSQTARDVAVVPRGFEPLPRAGRLVQYEPVDPEGVALRGRHNLENAGAAAAAARARGIEDEAIAAALASFGGVAHRLEEITERDGVVWVNDSKATNVASTIVALESFDGGVHLIAGGRGKGEDLSRLRELVGERCRAVYLIGETAPELRATLEGAAELHDSGDLETAVAAAAERARPGDTVLLSPAAASFDQFENFEARGERFRALVDDGR
jgi:UDP-N-acetylmuramoylalanine--D-glutamate ligase